MKDSKGLLVVISGFSGAGKGTVMKELIGKYNDYELSVSATTRNPREGECHGLDYFFKTKEEFQDMIEKNELIEWAEYVGNYYGTPKSYIKKCLEKGKNVLLEIEMQGGILVKTKFPDAVLIFISTNSAKTLNKRLSNRGTETNEVIKKRLLKASEEVEYIKFYDYFIINDKLNDTVEQVNSIIRSERCKVNHCSDMVTKIKQELFKLKEGLKE